MSSGSTAINQYRNVQNKDIIENVSKSEFDKAQELQIQECIRAFNIELKHIQPLKSIFIKCDYNKTGMVLCKDFIKRLHKMNIQMPAQIFNFFINTLKEKDVN